MKYFVLLVIALSSMQKTDAQCTFVADTSNPIIGYTQFINNVFWNDPTVIKEGSTYHMWLSGGDITLPTNSLNSTLPYYSSSSDGLNWTINIVPLFTGNGSGTYDGFKVETPTVIKETGTYHMYYSSRSDPGDIFTISHATSTNVSSGWTKDVTNPIVSPTGIITDWNGAQVAEPAITVKNGVFYLFFAAVGCKDMACSTYPSSGQIKVARSIGLVTSTDGINFSAPTQVLTKGAMYPDAQNYEGYSTPYVYLDGNTFHLYYDVYQYISAIDDQRQVALHHATSMDGITWVEDPVPIFLRTDFAWTAMEVRAPSVINDGGTWKMWFAGNAELPIDSTKAGIGYAECGTIAGLNEFNTFDNVIVYPNPFDDQTIIEFPGDNNKIILTVYNSIGQIVNTEYQILANQLILKRGNLTKGIYFFKIANNNKLLGSGKLIMK